MVLCTGIPLHIALRSRFRAVEFLPPFFLPARAVLIEFLPTSDWPDYERYDVHTVSQHPILAEA